MDSLQRSEMFMATNAHLRSRSSKERNSAAESSLRQARDIALLRELRFKEKTARRVKVTAAEIVKRLKRNL